MKLKNIVNNDTIEIMKKLLHGLDYKKIYIVKFLHDTSVDVNEVEVIKDKVTNEIMYKENK